MSENFYISNILEIKKGNASVYYDKLLDWLIKNKHKIEDTKKPDYIKFRFFFPLNEGDFGRSAIINFEEKKDDLLIQFNIPKPKIYDGGIYKPIELYKLLLNMYKVLDVDITHNVLKTIYSNEIIEDILKEIKKRMLFITILFSTSFLIILEIAISDGKWQWLPFLFLIVILFFNLYRKEYSNYKLYKRLKSESR